MIGKTLGHYQILEKLGQRGMGVVCKARDTHLERLAALKLLPPEKVADAEHKRRFVREAKCASALCVPPKRAERQEPDNRSDIFSFGSVFYEMLTRRNAFQFKLRLAGRLTMRRTKLVMDGCLFEKVTQALKIKA